MRRRSFLTGIAACATPGTALGADTPVVKFRDLYARGGAFSDFTLAHADKVVGVDGYMAPPLKAQARFFVLTKLPMSYCPFCETAAEWPEDILVVYTRDVIDVVAFNYLIRATGRLELGPYTDRELGFWSRARLRDAAFARL